MNAFGNQNGGSLFGQQNNSQQGTGLFGQSSTTGTFGQNQSSQPSVLGASGSAFGSSAPKRTQSVGGVFGSGSPAPTTGGTFGAAGATGPNTGGTGLFGSAAGNNPGATGSSGLFGGATQFGGNTGLNKPAASTSFGANNNPPNTSLFGQNNQQNTNSTQSTGLFGNNNQSGQSGGLFGQSAQQPSTGGSLFGKPQTGGTSLFGAPKPATGSLFGGQGQTQTQTQPQQGGGLFGGAASGSAQPNGGGLFGSSNASNSSSNTAGGGLFGGSSSQPALSGTSGSSLLGNNTGGGLFGNNNQSSGAPGGGGLFGSTNTNSSSFTTKPASSGMFGTLTGAAQQSQQPQQQTLHATIDQASYILQGVAPSQKLYTSLTQPAQKRTAHEAHGYNGFTSKDTFKSTRRDVVRPSKLHLDPPKSSPVTIAGPSARDPGVRAVVSSASITHGEPRQWVNSFDRFLKERPTTLTIKRDGRHHVALPNPPVSTAPPTIASVAADTSTANSKLVPDSTAMADTSVAPVEPDVSLFHRQANNMTVVQVRKKALEEGYYIFPRLESLSAMSKAQLAAVSNLVVGRENFGQIEYPGSVDLSRIANLGDILGSLVVFEAGTVCVYPDEDSKALPGHELNLPCTVTIENAWPIDAVTRKRITDMEDPRMQKHIARLREKCESDGGEFVTFAQGIWVFKVPHFSKWGLPVEDMVVDSEEDKLTPPNAGGSPILVTVDDHGEPATVSGVEPSDAEDDSMVDAELESPDLIETWQDQLSHAAVSCYTASQEALAAAATLPQSYDLGSVLLPNQRADEEKEVLAKGSESAGNDSVERSSLLREVKAALHGPLRLDTLRRHASKHTRDNSALPLLQTKLSSSLLQSLAPAREELWTLLATLYAPEGLDREKLSQWLEKKVSSVPVASHDDPFDTVWDFLTTHRLKEAVSLSLKSNNPHLAVLISLFDGHNVSASDAEMQLRNWKENRSLASVPAVVRHIWELASGVAPAATGLSWSQWLGMRLWYSDSSVEDAVSKVPASLISGAGPELSLIRQTIGSKQLKAVTDELPLVDEFLFLQALNTVSPITSKQDLKCYDSVCASLAKVLQDVGDANTAVYVALHVKDTKHCFETVRDILVKVPDSISLTVTHDLGVPEQLLDEARAAHARNIEDYRSGADYLLRAGLYEQAHQLIITYVAPQAVLDKRLDEIEDLLVSLELKKDQLRRWSLGGEVYLQYLRAARAGDRVERYDVKAICNSCRYAHTPNLQSQAAISTIAKWASSTSFAKTDFGLDVVLNMKFDPSQTRLVALQQASRLLK